MNEVLLCGFDELSPMDKTLVVNHVMDLKNWARATDKTKAAFEAQMQSENARKGGAQKGEEYGIPKRPTSTASATPVSRTAPKPSAFVDLTLEEDAAVPPVAIPVLSPPLDIPSIYTSIVPAAQPIIPSNHRGRFLVPIPNVNGARPMALAGKKVVLTGIFPEVRYTYIYI